MGDVIDFQARRRERVERRRRAFGRTVFRSVLGTWASVERDGSPLPVELVDVSPGGCSFRVPAGPGGGRGLKRGEGVALRIYFTADSYLPAFATVRHRGERVDGDGGAWTHYGCAFDASLPSFEAVRKFVEFIESFAEHSSEDRAAPGAAAAAG